MILNLTLFLEFTVHNDFVEWFVLIISSLVPLFHSWHIVTFKYKTLKQPLIGEYIRQPSQNYLLYNWMWDYKMLMINWIELLNCCDLFVFLVLVTCMAIQSISSLSLSSSMSFIYLLLWFVCFSYGQLTQLHPDVDEYKLYQAQVCPLHTYLY